MRNNNLLTLLGFITLVVVFLILAGVLQIPKELGMDVIKALEALP